MYNVNDKFSLPVVVKHPVHYLGLWVLLLVFAATILSFHLNVRYEYSPVESILAIGANMPLFAVIFYLWFAVLLVLLFFSGEHSCWHKPALLAIFALVFGGLWIINSPNGGHPDFWMQFGNIKYIMEEGRLVFGHPALGYLEWPIFHVFNAALAFVGNIPIIKLPQIFLIYSFILLSFILYLLVKKCIVNSSLAALGALLIIVGSVAGRMLGFWPGNISFLLLVSLLILLLSNTSLIYMRFVFVTLLLLVVFAVSYLPHPVYFIFIVSGVYLLQKIARKEAVNSIIIVFFIVIFLSWNTYFAYVEFKSFAVWSKHFIEGITAPEGVISQITRPVGQSFGGITPLWAVITRYIWLSIFAAAGILGISNLFRFRKLNPIIIILTGGLMGAVIFTLVCAVTFGAQAQWVRFQQIGPLFLIPILLVFLAGLKADLKIKKYVFFGLIMLLMLFSLPTFLLVGKEINSNTVYSYETEPLSYLEPMQDNGDMYIYTDSVTRQMYFTYLYRVYFHTYSSDNNMLWDRLDLLSSSYSDNLVGNAYFVINDRFLMPLHYPHGILNDDPKLIEIVNRLEKTDYIYNNGHVMIFRSLVGGLR
jgi:hypothetical protein